MVSGRADAVFDRINKLADKVWNVDGRVAGVRDTRTEDGSPTVANVNAGTQSQSYANVTKSSPAQKKVMFCTMEANNPPDSDCEVHIPMSSVVEVTKRLDNSVYGYFLGKRIAFPVVKHYAQNAWGKFGLEKVSMHKGFMFFKFSTVSGVEQVMENGPWLIRGSPLILKVWTPSVCLTKEDLTKVSVWIKLHDIPLVAFTAESLSLISSRIGTPIRLDTYTNAMCLESWGRSNYARAMIEVNAATELKESITIAVPRLDGEGYVKENVRIEYEWKPPRCSTCKVFGHGVDLCPKIVKQNEKAVANQRTQDDGFIEVKRGGKGAKPREQVNKQNLVYRRKKVEAHIKSKENVSTSNSFKVLNDDISGAEAEEDIPKDSEFDRGDVVQENTGKAPLSKRVKWKEPLVASNSLSVGDEDDSEIEMVYDETTAFMTCPPTNSTKDSC